MKYFSKKRVLMCVLLVVALFTVIGLFFPIVSFSMEDDIFESVFGDYFDQIMKGKLKYTLCGFDMLLPKGRILQVIASVGTGMGVLSGFDSLSGGLSAINAFSVLGLIVGFGVMAGLIGLFFMVGDRIPEKYLWLATGVCGFFLLIYMIEGIVAVSSITNLVKRYSQEYGWFYENWKEYYNELGLKCGTASFVPLLISGIFVGAYFFVRTKLPEDGEPLPFAFMQSAPVEGNNIVLKTETIERVTPVAKKKEQVSSISVKQRMENIELLKKYKEMLDDGIITQEEFEKKKIELL